MQAASSPSARIRSLIPAWLPLAAAAATLYAFFEFRESLIPFALSFAVAYAANPAVAAFEAKGWRREHVVVLLYAAIALGITGAANFLLPTLSEELSLLQSQAPFFFRRTLDALAHLQADLARRLPVGQGLVERMDLKMYNPLMEHLERLPGYLLGLLPLLSLLFLVPFITFYMLMDSSRLMRQAVQACPGRYAEQALHIFIEIDSALGHYLRGVLLEATAIGVGTFAGLYLLGVPYALGIAALSGATSVIPYAGTVIGAAAGAGIALFQFRSLWAAAEVLALFGLIHLADNLFLQPVISRRSVHLHPLVYLLALMIGGQAFGFAGLLFGVPTVCIFKALLEVAWEWHASQELALRPESVPGARIPYL